MRSKDAQKASSHERRSKLFDCLGDSDDDYDEEPLTLVNERHPVTIRRQEREGKWPKKIGNDTSVVQNSAFLDLPFDIIDIILHYVGLGGQGGIHLARLRLTCKALHSSTDLQKALFQKMFSIGTIPTATYKEHREYSKPCYDQLLAMLEDGLGPRIHKFVAHEFMSIKDLQHVTRACPNLTCLDVTGIMEPIDFTRYKNYFSGCRHGLNQQPKEDIPKHERVPFTDIYEPSDFKENVQEKLQPYLEEQSKCYACRDRFQWPLVLKNCPDLFSNLTSLRIMYEGHTKKQVRGSKPGRKHLPYLLNLMPRLQSLSLECWRDTEEKFPDAVMSWFECAPNECKRFEKAIVNNASHELRLLELNGIIELVPDIYKFQKALEKLPKLRTIKMALYHDLKRRAAQTWLDQGKRVDQNDSSAESVDAFPPDPNNRDLLIEYITGLRKSISRGWSVQSINISDGYLLAKPWRYFSLLTPENIDHLRWLLHSDLDWNPIWKWKSYMYRDLLRESWRPSRHDPDILADSQQLRQLFGEVRAAGKPVRLRLATPGEEDSFFAWQLGSRAPVIGQGNYDVLPWRLDVIGDLVDEIELLWRDSYTFGAEQIKYAPHNVTPEVAAEHLCAYLKRTREPVERRLRVEAERMAPFFERLKSWCPGLKKLKLYIPAALYPDCDREFIERVLPGEAAGWTVKHVDALPNYSGYTKDLVIEEETGMWGCDSDDEGETEFDLNRRRKVGLRPIVDKIRKFEGERCPTIERVFEWRVDADGRLLRGLPSVDEEWHRTVRGPNLRCFDVTALRSERKFEYLWPT